MKHWKILTYRLAKCFLHHPRSLEVRAWEHKRKWNNKILRGVCIATHQVGCISYALKFEQCAYAAVSVPYELLAALHQIKICALIPNSWFRGFCRTPFQTRWAGAGNLEDTVFANKLSEKPGPSQSHLLLQHDAHVFAPRLRRAFQPPRECQYERWKSSSRVERLSCSGTYRLSIWRNAL